MGSLLQISDSLVVIVLLVMACGYFAGAIPVGPMFSQWVIGKDIRKMGSGGAGATNVLRNVNKSSAFLTLLLDMAKSALPAWIFLEISPQVMADDLALLAGFCAILGHIYPCWSQFKGGKGVATVLGVLAVVEPSLLILGVGLWLIIAAISTFSSLSSLIMVIALPLLTIILELDFNRIFVFTLISALVVSRHRENILRLLSNTESSIRFLTSATALKPSMESTYAESHSNIEESADFQVNVTENTLQPSGSEGTQSPPEKTQTSSLRRGYTRPETTRNL